MLKLEGVSVSIGPVGILRNVRLQVGPGEFAGLIGRNGAWKTPLARAIMAPLRRHERALEFEGAPRRGIPTHRRVSLGIGYMPEDRRLVPGLTVEENVLRPAWSARFPDMGERLERV